MSTAHLAYVDSNFGCALVDDALLMQTSKLWTDQEFTPDDLVAAETACRIILAHSTIVSIGNFRTDARFAPDNWADCGQWNGPHYPRDLFSFPYPVDLPTASEIASEEPTANARAIAEHVREHLRNELRLLPDEAPKDAVNSWFNGWERHPGAHVTKEIAARSEARRKGRLLTEEELTSETAFLDQTAECILTFGRRHFSTYGGNPVLDLAHKMMFEVWPDQLFKKLDEAYFEFEKGTMLPGSPVPLPPILKIVLTRAGNRNEILPTLLEMRDELEKPRKALWLLMLEMRYDQNPKVNSRAAQRLTAAAENLFKSAYPDKRVSGLWVGLMAALQSWAHLAKEYWEADAANRAVSSVSFAHRLGQALKELQPSEQALRRHLSKAELRHFGME
jgi:hypothetical protein